ncbi:hypothetical protein CC80DRAFT_559231 [Byssothecium circinans]|uniref:Fungal STAND N-terminal Goodbye domain-containing protein n=1 Tax=Byssothecium circinans TaxID=147558 RepID=A0A6A5U0W0_9PLEO|nr:hypothetical protein CC80DRAFT_559231 [Byssothecium circinans]
MVVRKIELPPEEATDLASLWSRAVKEYESTTNADLSKMKAQSTEHVVRNVTEMMDEVEKRSDKFLSFRHKKDKVSKAREAIGKHLDSMQTCVDGISMIGAAASVFPPALPVNLVFAACGRVISAFMDIQNNLDKVEEFLGLSSRFFERLSIIEGTKCSDGPLGKAIVQSSQLS